MSERKRILVTNDDGIDARGIRVLVKTLSEVADIYVCAPKTEQSATGHGLTMGPGRYVDFIERQIPHTKLAYAVTGKPADCVKMGSVFCRRRKASRSITSFPVSTTAATWEPIQSIRERCPRRWKG